MNDLKKVPMIGTQFFINKYDTEDDIKKHMKLMKEYGISIIRLYMVWDHVEVSEGVYDFKKYDLVYSLAEKYELKIINTLTCEDPPGFHHETSCYHQNTNLNNKLLKEKASVYIKKVVTRYKDSKAHFGYILMNEPDLLVCYDDHTMKAFQEWLKKKYVKIEDLNARWFGGFEKFEDIRIKDDKWNEFWCCFYSFIDWNEFLTDNLIDHLLWIKDEILKYDEKAFTHVNPKCLLDNCWSVGQNVWKEGKIVDTLGASIHPAWNFSNYCYKDYFRLIGYCVDLVRAGAGEKPFWITELQGGSTIKTGNNSYCPTEDELLGWLWNAIGAGAEAIIYWMWHPRDFGQEAGEWGLVSIDHRISKRLEQSKFVSDILEQYKEFFAQAKPVENRVAIYYGQSSEILTQVEGPAYNRKPNKVIEAVLGAYFILTQSGYCVDIISEETMLESNQVSKYKAIIFPNAFSLSNSILRSIQEYVYTGGKIIADVLFSWKNEYGELRREQDSIFKEVFGLHINEYRATRSSQMIDVGAFQFQAFNYIADVTNYDASKIATIGEKDIITKNTYGSGEAIYIGSDFFPYINELVKEEQIDTLKQLRHIVSENIKEVDAFFLHTESMEMQKRVLVNDKEYVVIIINGEGVSTYQLEININNYQQYKCIDLIKNIEINFIDECHKNKTQGYISETLLSNQVQVLYFKSE